MSTISSLWSQVVASSLIFLLNPVLKTLCSEFYLDLKKDTFGRTVVNFKEKTANGSEPFRFLKLNHPHRSLFCSFEVFNSYFFEFTWNFYLSPDFVTSVIDYWGPKWQRLESNRFYGHVATLQKFYYFKA